VFQDSEGLGNSGFEIIHRLKIIRSVYDILYEICIEALKDTLIDK
jgi:hypothetical protein